MTRVRAKEAKQACTVDPLGEPRGRSTRGRFRALALPVILCTGLAGAGFTQPQEEQAYQGNISQATSLSRKLSNLVGEESLKDAVYTAIDLHALHPPIFGSYLNDSLSQSLGKEARGVFALRFLEELMEQDIRALSNQVQPITLAARVIAATESEEFEQIAHQLKDALGETSNYLAKTERYGLFIVEQLIAKGYADGDFSIPMVRRIIKNLEASPILAQTQLGFEGRNERAWHRYMLAYSYNLLALLTIDGRYVDTRESSHLMKQVARYSPDVHDRVASNAYFYDAHFLHEGEPVYEYRFKYVNYLESSGRAEEALHVQSEVTFLDPTDDNVNRLAELFQKNHPDDSFRDYWHETLNGRGKVVPPVEVEFDHGVLDLSQTTERWIYIDVWGTWCAPCVRELPELQAAYVANDPSKTGIEIYTFSSRSTQLPAFMKKWGFTFPVAEIGQDVLVDFQVSEFPTHILVTPAGKYLKLDRKVPLDDYFRNFILLEGR